MSYTVIVKHPRFPEQHVLPNGNISESGAPRRFKNKDAAREVAASWAQHFADAGHQDTTVVVRKVGV